MSEIKFAVKIDHCDIMSEAVQKLAIQTGYIWRDAYHVGKDILEVSIYGIVFYDDGHMEYDLRDEKDITYKTVSQAIKLLQKPINKKIMIAGEEVKFNKDGHISVGCQSIDFDTLEQVYKIALKKKGEN